MELCKGGDVFSLIKCGPLTGDIVFWKLSSRSHRFCSLIQYCRNELEKNREQGLVDTACSTAITRFYTAELVDALEFIHGKVCTEFMRHGVHHMSYLVTYHCE